VVNPAVRIDVSALAFQYVRQPPPRRSLGDVIDEAVAEARGRP
jgi:hypothetical protein